MCDFFTAYLIKDQIRLPVKYFDALLGNSMKILLDPVGGKSDE